MVILTSSFFVPFARGHGRRWPNRHLANFSVSVFWPNFLFLKPNPKDPNPKPGRGDHTLLLGFVHCWSCCGCVCGCCGCCWFGTLRQTALTRTPSPPDRPKFRSFFPSPAPISLSSSLNFCVFLKAGTVNVPVWALQTCTFQARRFKKPPKFHEKTPRETQNERNGGGRGKKAKFWASHRSGPHPSELDFVLLVF